jgi:2-polyprenyl-3-methyl-5-hydroxy-6-metoxy-1,4-benzoquinol methylase
MTVAKTTLDKAGKDYWDSLWEGQKIPEAINPRDFRRWNLIHVRMDALFRAVFSGMETRGRKLLEIGCAKSAWLPYFAREFGFQVSGLDYSEIGCEQERAVLEKAGVAGEVVCADLFSPPEGMRGAYDVVVSFGVVEHFEETEVCLQAMGMYLKPGGMMITLVPNLTGMIGWLFKVLNRPVYEMHVRLGPKQLRAAHEAAGLVPLQCHFYLSTHFGVVNLSSQDKSRWSTKVRRWIVQNLGRFSSLVWVIEHHTFALPATRLFAPYVLCIAQKQTG